MMTKKRENQLVNPCVNLTTAAGKSHLRLKSGLTLLELQVTANCSPSLRMTLPFWESVTAGGSSGTGWEDQERHYCIRWLIMITQTVLHGDISKMLAFYSAGFQLIKTKYVNTYI